MGAHISQAGLELSCSVLHLSGAIFQDVCCRRRPWAHSVAFLALSLMEDVCDLFFLVLTHTQ